MSRNMTRRRNHTALRGRPRCHQRRAPTSSTRPFVSAGFRLNPSTQTADNANGGVYFAGPVPCSPNGESAELSLRMKDNRSAEFRLNLPSRTVDIPDGGVCLAGPPPSPPVCGISAELSLGMRDNRADERGPSVRPRAHSWSADPKNQTGSVNDLLLPPCKGRPGTER